MVDWWKAYKLQNITNVDMNFHRWKNFNTSIKRKNVCQNTLFFENSPILLWKFASGHFSISDLLTVKNGLINIDCKIIFCYKIFGTIFKILLKPWYHISSLFNKKSYIYYLIYIFHYLTKLMRHYYNFLWILFWMNNIFHLNHKFEKLKNNLQ